MKLRTVHRQTTTSQQGVALVISLILLVVMTLLGITAIRSVTMEEQMSGHAYDRSLAFQATESALRSAELLVESVKPTPSSGCSVMSALMVCGPPAVNATERWLDSSFADWTASDQIGTGSLAVTPEYFVEYLGNTFPCRPGDASDTNDCKRYRITARSKDNVAGRASVMLQSVYATE